MELSNKYNLPEVVVNALMKNDYDFNDDPDYISATSLKKDPLEYWLGFYHRIGMIEGDLGLDISENLWSFIGNAIHDKFYEKAYSEGELIKEKRLEYALPKRLVMHDDSLDGYFYVTGKPDAVEVATKTLIDYKITSMWKYIYGNFADWELQLNIYAWLLYEVRNIKIEKASIIMVLRDWTKREALKHNIPDSPIVRQDFDLKPVEETEKIVFERLETIMRFRDKHIMDMPICSDENRWLSETKYKVFQLKSDGTPKVRATRVFNTYEDAALFVGDNSGYIIKTYPGEERKCKEYCRYRKICPFARSKYFPDAEGDVVYKIEVKENLVSDDKELSKEETQEIKEDVAENIEENIETNVPEDIAASENVAEEVDIPFDEVFNATKKKTKRKDDNYFFFDKYLYEPMYRILNNDEYKFENVYKGYTLNMEKYLEIKKKYNIDHETVYKTGGKDVFQSEVAKIYNIRKIIDLDIFRKVFSIIREFKEITGYKFSKDFDIDLRKFGIFIVTDKNGDPRIRFLTTLLSFDFPITIERKNKLKPDTLIYYMSIPLVCKMYKKFASNRLKSVELLSGGSYIFLRIIEASTTYLIPLDTTKTSTALIDTLEGLIEDYSKNPLAIYEESPEEKAFISIVGGTLLERHEHVSEEEEGIIDKISYMKFFINKRYAHILTVIKQKLNKLKEEEIEEIDF